VRQETRHYREWFEVEAVRCLAGSEPLRHRRVEASSSPTAQPNLTFTHIAPRGKNLSTFHPPPQCLKISTHFSTSSSSSRMRVMNHNLSATKQRLHPQSVAEMNRHSVVSGDRIRQCVLNCRYVNTVVYE